jgi:NAD(P)-dependent dehydrogenase (short-subunit alcohol dehydrogenase family)
MALAVVTGAGKGIGYGVAERLVHEGWRVAIVDADPAADKAAAELGSPFYQCDVTDHEQIHDVFTAIAAAEGPISGLVNSAGLTRTAPSESLSAADWQTVLNVDLSGTFYACQASFPHLAPKAAIVNVASIAAVRALPGRVAYTAAKFGVVGVTRVLAVEWAHRGVRVNAVGPTWTETPFLQDLVSAGKLDKEQLQAKMPMGRLANVDDVTNAIIFLLGEGSAFITGQTLYVDGGYTWAG